MPAHHRDGRPDRTWRRPSLWLLAAAAAATLGCPAYTTRPPLAPAEAEAPTGFSSERAWRDLETLVSFGPRYPGSEGNRQARAYLQEQLTTLGLEIDERPFEITTSEGETLEPHNFTATIPGDGRGSLLLITHYDTDFFPGVEIVGANDGGSGPALLLELARTFVANPTGYPTVFVFLDAQSLAPAPFNAPNLSHLGVRGFLSEYGEDGTFDDVRLTLVFDQVADADLQLTRDLWSHRLDRALFVKAAARLGHADVVPARGTVIDFPGAHQVLFRSGFRRLMTVKDAAYGEAEPPGTYAHSADDNLDHCAPESLATVGRITEAALRDATARWAKLDPLRPARPPAAEPAPATDVQEEPAMDAAVGESAEPAPETMTPAGLDAGDASAPAEADATEAADGAETTETGGTE